MIAKLILVILSCFLLVSCQMPQKDKVTKKDVFYEIFPASFNDSNNDGVGDLKGIIEKLDYLDHLGVKNIWLTPIHPSPTYHKYDVLDYYGIDAQFGTIADFKNLIAQANKHDIGIIIDLVLNHTSSKHPWFIKAKDAFLNNRCDQVVYCQYYNFSTKPKAGYTKIKDGYYYEARFWSEMPDLNLDSPLLRKEIQKIVDYWLDLGVKGMRLDAVLYYYQNDIKRNNEFVSWLNKVIKAKKADAFLVGEVYSNNDIVEKHYRSGIDSLFDFDSSGPNGLITQAIASKNGQFLSHQLIEKYTRINFKSSIFLSNHDQGRSGGFLNTLDKQKLAGAIYLLSPAIPFIYYGEEIGMLGSGKDENKRLAMKWGNNNDPKNPINSTYNIVPKTNVKEALKDPNSLLNHYIKIIRLRNTYIKNLNAKANILNNKSIFSIKYDNITIMINLNNQKEKVEGRYKILEQLYNSKNHQTYLEIDGYDVLILEK